MNTAPTRTGLQLRSLIRRSGELELSLVNVPVPAPGPDEVVLRVEAAPINPSDIGLLFGAADMATARQAGAVTTASIPERAMKAMAGRLEQSMAVGNEGAGVVVEAGASAAAQALLGTTVAVLGGAMYSQYRCVKVEQCLLLPDGTTPAEGASALRQPADGAGHGRDDAARGPQGAGAHGGGIEPRPDAEPDLPAGRYRPGEHRAQAGAGGAAARRRARFTSATPARRPSWRS